MATYPVPHNESERLAELRRFAILDTPPEEYFDQLTRLAAHACEVPIALISLVDSDRQWFKSRFGLEADQTPREHAFCAYTIMGTEPLVIENAITDPRFAETALVGKPNGIRFYAAAPLITMRGLALGTICVIDRRPRTLSERQLVTLRLLATQVMQQLELRLNAESMRRQTVLMDKLQHVAEIGGWEIDLRTRALTFTDQTFHIFGVNREEFVPSLDSALAFCLREDRGTVRHAVEIAESFGIGFDLDFQLERRDGVRRWVRATGRREDDDGAARRLFGTLQDITDRRALESEVVLITQREQLRIGSDLHDGLGQELTGILYLIGSLFPDVPQTATRFRQQLRTVESMVGGAITTCRTIARGLAPIGGGEDSFVLAVRQLAARLELVHPVKIAVRKRGIAVAADEHIAVNLYRIAQEAITNAIKYGPARQISVSINAQPAYVTVSVKNDGRPFRAADYREGLGMGTMRYRAHLIRATLTIGPTANGDTRVVCRLPLMQRNRAAAGERHPRSPISAAPTG